jgi:hypothetical protein
MIIIAIGRRRAGLAIGVLLTLLIAGCAGRTGDSAQPLPSAAPVQDLLPRWRSCPDEPFPPDSGQNDPSRLPRLADTFHPVAAIICGIDIQSRPDGGTDVVATEERIDDVEALLTALRLPDEPPRELCPAIINGVPWLAMLDAEGHWVRPRVPLDGCVSPRAEVATVIDPSRRTRTTRVLYENESPEEAASGCGDKWKDEVWQTGANSDTANRPPEALDKLLDDDARVYECIYRVPASEQRTDEPVGEITSLHLLPAGRWAAIKRQIQASTPVQACNTPASRFALLMPGTIYVELDGCRRILVFAARQGADTLRQAPAALTDLLTKP